MPPEDPKLYVVMPNLWASTQYIRAFLKNKNRHVKLVIFFNLEDVQRD